MNEEGNLLRKIFNEAVEIADAPRRANYLAGACGADSALRQRIEELLVADAEAGRFLGAVGETVAKVGRNTAGGSALHAEFRTTHWSLVLSAGQSGEPKALEAMGRLCRNYWYPLYAYVRRRGYRTEEAQDLTQSFFARLLEKNSLEVANPERGRFRSFLLAALANFLNNQWDHARAAKRGGGCEVVSWDAQYAEERYQQEPFHEETPERVYERRWALTVLESAMKALCEEYRAGGKVELFETLQVCLSGERSVESYAELAARLGLSEGAVKVAVHRLRQRFGDALRLTIGQTLGREEDIDEELAHLVSMLG